MLRLLGNLRLAASTASTHLSDDPVLLAIQISRRLPSGLVRRLAGMVEALTRHRGSHLPVARALSAHLLGRTATVASILRSAPDAGIGAGSAGRLADVALAAGMLHEADALLARAGSSTATAGQRARRRWYDGDMTGAVGVLREAGRDRHAERLAGEVRVYEGWTPSLPDVPGYEPLETTVLHLLTNSLPHTGSGYAQRTHSLLKAQLDAGWTVHAATRIGYPVQVGKIFADDVDVLEGVSYHRLLPVPMARGFERRLQQQAEELLELARELRPGVLHATTPFVNGIVVEEVARALGIPWAYEARGQLADTWASTRPAYVKTSERYRLFTDREAQVMRNASLVVTLGEAMKQGIVRKGVPEEKILLSLNAVGDEYLEEPVAPGDARRGLGLPEDGVFVGTVSSLVDYEGLPTLLRAVALLAPTHPELRCLIVGDGAAAPALKSLTLELGIASRVTFTGRVPRHQARSYHQALDVFVVPRRDLDVTSAVTPLKPVEAMACSRPVVASDLPALREIVQDGVTGLLVEPEKPTDLADAIRRLVDHASVRTEYGSNGRAQALATRVWSRNAAELSGAYRRAGGTS
ncbi:glycosyltransferase [Arthrobacter agilis]|uniref:glycosyltransferase family 4 protein n=1 Tax=Arthrobacter agilis TaxID=37921 RepID=UPI000B3507E6|nr:glycosyltransferase family 4 protein [Arthrobacter agilis]PPB47738.1 glycosyltransferase WbuB [Arthrobacter agilis]TPV21677.1 glycosyltransferase [Arthrobacter agilis]VDR32433.1 D-inositol-3-phosphate glycosyltransferase [Arthrobacter agilis]